MQLRNRNYQTTAPQASPQKAQCHQNPCLGVTPTRAAVFHKPTGHTQPENTSGAQLCRYQGRHPATTTMYQPCSSATVFISWHYQFNIPEICSRTWNCWDMVCRSCQHLKTILSSFQDCSLQTNIHPLLYGHDRQRRLHFTGATFCSTSDLDCGGDRGCWGHGNISTRKLKPGKCTDFLQGAWVLNGATNPLKKKSTKQITNKIRLFGTSMNCCNWPDPLIIVAWFNLSM